MRGVGKLAPRIGDGVVGFGEVGFFLDGGVGDGVEVNGNPAVGDEFAAERNEFKRVASVVHARHLRPRVVHGIVAKQTVGRVGAIFGRYTTGDVDEPVQTGHAGQSNRLIARHAGTVTPVPVGGIVDLHQSRRLNGGIGIGVVVADGIDGIAHHGALVVLLRFLKLLNGRHPSFVDKVEHLDGLRVGFITRLRRVNVNASADEKHFLGRWKVGGTRTGSHLGQANTGRGRPRHGRSLEFGQARGGRLREVAVRETVRFCKINHLLDGMLRC